MSDELKFGTQSSLQTAWTPLQKEWQTFELISDIRFNSTDYCDVIGDYSHPCHGRLHRTILLHWSAGTSWKRRDKRPLSTEPKTLQQDVNMSWPNLAVASPCFPDIVLQHDSKSHYLRNLQKVIPNHCKVHLALLLALPRVTLVLRCRDSFQEFKRQIARHAEYARVSLAFRQ